MSELIKETAKEDIQRAKVFAQDAARSGGYLYPFRGILYYVSHRDLWKPLLSKLAPSVTLGLGITVFMFTFTYIPQAAILALVNGPLAIFSTIVLVLNESSTIFNAISKAFIIDDALIDTFDGVLLAQNLTNIVSEGRQIKSGTDPISKLGKIIKKPFARFTPQAIIRYFMYLPLNFIPVVGTVMFVFLQGKKLGPTVHTRYFQLKGMKKSQRDEFVERRQAAYTSFGVPAVLLEMIPFFGIFFAFTNTVGAALWAADIEKGKVE